jgi:outer membrane protein OmpA-like peptidoglycan-associated protein
VRTIYSGLLPFLLAASVSAQVKPMGFEASLYAGAWEGDAVYDSAATYGGRLRFNISRLFGIEASFGNVATSSIERAQAGITKAEDINIGLFGFDGVLHLADGKFVPYLTAGVGFIALDENFFSSNAGGGAVYHFNKIVGARIDGRGWFSGDAPATDRFHHLELTGGIVIKFLGDSDRDKDGIEDDVDQCPMKPEDRDGFEDSDGCPDVDNDSDGILDGDDKCPLKAEDKDGDRDEDGCPEEDIKPPPPVVVDSDKDGIPDEKDRCPQQAENKNGVEDEDGCPETKVIITRKKIEIKDKVYFETDKDIIKAQSHEILSAVAKVLMDYPHIELIEIHGHTDNRGTEEHNQELSQRRADAVKTYLMETGKIDGARLSAKGFGQSKPLQEGDDEAAWSKNRRVEFIILKEAADTPKVKYVPAKPKDEKASTPAPAPAAPAADKPADKPAEAPPAADAPAGDAPAGDAPEADKPAADETPKETEKPKGKEDSRNWSPRQNGPMFG